MRRLALLILAALAIVAIRHRGREMPVQQANRESRSIHDGYPSRIHDDDRVLVATDFCGIPGCIGHDDEWVTVERRAGG